MFVCVCVCVWFVFAIGCNPGCRRTLSVVQNGLELTEILLLLPSQCWDQRCTPPRPALGVLFLNSIGTFKNLGAPGDRLAIFYTAGCPLDPEDQKWNGMV